MGPKSYDEGLVLAAARTFTIESIIHILKTAPKARSTPNGHARVDDDRRPQSYSTQSQANARVSEEGRDGNIVNQHRGD
jgi:hypothetical protein